MFLLRLVGKMMLILVWILIAISWIFVKAVVSIYSFARGFVVFGLCVLMIGTVICYHDWKQFFYVDCWNIIVVAFVWNFYRVSFRNNEKNSG